MRKKFSEWYTKQVDNALQAGIKLENINIDFKLTIMKPLHAKWIVEYYNLMTSSEGTDIVINGWKKAGIYDAVKNGLTSLPSIDPFIEIASLVDCLHNIDEVVNVSEEIRESYVNDKETQLENIESEDESDEKWGPETDDFL